MKKKDHSLLFIFITIFIDITGLGIIIPVIPAWPGLGCVIFLIFPSPGAFEIFFFQYPNLYLITPSLLESLLQGVVHL